LAGLVTAAEAARAIREWEGVPVTTAKIRGYGVEINGALQNVSFDDAYDAEDWVKMFIKREHLRGGVTIAIVRTTVVMAEDQN
jgi:hypothetical protein